MLADAQQNSEGDMTFVPSIPFPFPPYEVQQQLMTHLYTAFERGGIGIFESPTGTGKSLSIICAALQWLTVSDARDLEAALQPDDVQLATPQSSDRSTTKAEPDWLANFSEIKEQDAQRAKARRLKQMREALAARLAAISSVDSIKQHRGAGKTMNGRHSQRDGVKRRKQAQAAAAASSGADEAAGDGKFLVDEYLSGEDAHSSSSGSDTEAASSSDEREDAREEAEWRELGITQVLYCSRTHSQTSQFVNEVKKTAFAAGVRCVTLGGRRNLCINPAVSSLSSDARMTDACLDLQKGKKKASCGSSCAQPPPAKRAKQGVAAGGGRKGEKRGCEWLSVATQREFRDHALAAVRDIEELGELGRGLHACPYYGTRKAAALAQLVVMPYAALLQRETRRALGVRLRGNVVIVDEAHNIVEAVNAVHSAVVRLRELRRAHFQLAQYLARYAARLKGKNVFYVNTILRMLQSLIRFLEKGATQDPPSGGGAAAAGEAASAAAAAAQVLRINDFAFRAGIDNVNLFKVERYMRRSGICRKIMGFLDLTQTAAAAAAAAAAGNGAGTADRYAEGAAGGAAESSAQADAVPAQVRHCRSSAHAGEDVEVSAAVAYVSRHVSSLQTAHQFLMALTNADKDGRVIVRRPAPPPLSRDRSAGPPAPPTAADADNDGPSLKFIMLNPAVHFAEIAREARAVVLIGGTMQPAGAIAQQLFPGIAPRRAAAAAISTVAAATSTGTLQQASSESEGAAAGGLEVFSCGHVIPPENILPLCVSRGPSGGVFNFTFAKRGSPEQMDELCRLLSNVCALVPGGVVCFLPSFGYMEQVLQCWKASGALHQLSKRKAIFSEPRAATEVESILAAYSAAIHRSSGSGGGGGGGALLLSVVGAKMSEGINFSDDLARCVVMVGMPFPDARDPELRQKIEYADAADPAGGGRAGRALYQAMCMRAVNQSIGRCIRHARDYGAVLLVDERYARAATVAQLPSWIAARAAAAPAFGDAARALGAFFRARRAAAAAAAAAAEA
ncbi:helicase C-terminal domain-containing protein [Tribonema minus]|uniref:Helicase C-terminal domain-containing protein n=1 Tax=Tribonema minus TaxID=303371 RepID=A0A835YWY4_9STRA|nr:helicase C-terminal domain-containing protein [Tribonema minus]